jgi:hypothetical protein
MPMRMLQEDWITMAFRPIRREHAVRYFENVIISFVITLLGTRIFLEITGYPQIATGGLHIAHVLWGGLFLLMASLIALVYRNQLLLTLSSILTGIGWGLFIDELGKFVTADNDYFFRPAAPIIYLSFLCLWFVAWYMRRDKAQSANTQIYHILDNLEELIEASVDRDELRAMKQQLVRLSQDRQDGITDELALALLHFIEREDIKASEEEPSFVPRWIGRARQSINTALLAPRMSLYAVPTVLAFLGALRLFNSCKHLLPLVWPSLPASLHADLDVSPFSSSANMWLFLLMNAIRLVIAMLLLRAARGVFSQQQEGWPRARTALVLAITFLDLLVFYFNQFSAAVVAVMDVILLGWTNHHQRRSRIEGLPQVPPSLGGAKAS